MATSRRWGCRGWVGLVGRGWVWLGLGWPVGGRWVAGRWRKGPEEVHTFALKRWPRPQGGRVVRKWAVLGAAAQGVDATERNHGCHLCDRDRQRRHWHQPTSTSRSCAERTPNTGHEPSGRDDLADRLLTATVASTLSGKLADPSDLLAHLDDAAALLDDEGVPDPEKITAAADTLLAAKPHLVVPQYDKRHRPRRSGKRARGGQSDRIDSRTRRITDRSSSGLAGLMPRLSASKHPAILPTSSVSFLSGSSASRDIPSSCAMSST